MVTWVGFESLQITNANAAAEDIRNAIVEAEQTADAEVRSVYLGVTGGHLRGFAWKIANRGFEEQRIWIIRIGKTQHAETAVNAQ